MLCSSSLMPLLLSSKSPGKDCRLWAAEDGGEHFCKHDARHGHTRLCGSGLLQHMQGHHCQRCVQ
ncbi:unnamed protein product, partial [Closterium sp. NIES-54]